MESYDCCEVIVQNNPAKLEEERLMRALSRQGKPGAGRPAIAKKVEASPEPQKKSEAKADGSIPAWKKAQMDRENEDKKRREDESRKKEEQAKLISARVAEFGLGANQEDDNIEKYLSSPRGGSKPQVEAAKPSFEDPVVQRAAADAKQREEELAHIPSYDERGNDERAAKEEERLMKMIGASK